MPDWRIKAAVQRGLSALPDPQRWNRVLQVRLSGSLVLTEPGFLEKWSWAQRHVSHHAHHTGRTLADRTAVELGTGWFPIVPLALLLSGAKTVYTVDIQDVLSVEQVRSTLEMCSRLLARGDISAPRPDAISTVRDALVADKYDSASSLLERLGIFPVIGDASSLDLTSDSVDLVTSDSTLEHVYPVSIVSIFEEFSRIVRADGVMSHHIDLADHFTTFDSGITVYNFLRFSDEQWKRYNSSLNYQNRLRIVDYREFHEAAGWRIVGEECSRKPIERLRSIPLAPEFVSYDESELAVHSAWIQSVKEVDS